MYKPYASESYYEGKYEGTLIPEDDQKKALIQASAAYRSGAGAGVPA